MTGTIFKMEYAQMHDHGTNLQCQQSSCIPDSVHHNMKQMTKDNNIHNIVK